MYKLRQRSLRFLLLTCIAHYLNKSSGCEANKLPCEKKTSPWKITLSIFNLNFLQRAFMSLLKNVWEEWNTFPWGLRKRNRHEVIIGECTWYVFPFFDLRTCTSIYIHSELNSFIYIYYAIIRKNHAIVIYRRFIRSWLVEFILELMSQWR